ncbi:MAG: IS110 family transposase [Planctomycetaceae bacterium]|nr:IS110 family transposase [Planctomycetaceae bacterium]
METLYPCCVGLDVHKKTVVACVRCVAPDGQVVKQVRSFDTFTDDLRALADWLATQGATRVALESTGVYWKPVWYILEAHGDFELMLVNAQQIKQVPGRKTDVKDAEWIAELLQHGLLRPSFVPPKPIRQLRDLTRQRAQLIAQRARVLNRIQKVLEDANIKLAGVATDVLGASGRAMIAALIAGEDDPAALAGRAKGSLRGKRAALCRALRGSVEEHHRFLLQALMDQVRELEGMIARFTARIAEHLRPFEELVRRLMTIPGVGRPAAEVIVAEIGVDMTRFATAAHLSSWAGMCPGNDQSAGKRRSGRTIEGSRWLRAALVQVAWAASRSRQTGLLALYRRWSRRLGAKRALVALGHRILVIIFKVLKDRTDYREPSAPAPELGQAA